jgi:hypothetical protein
MTDKADGGLFTAPKADVATRGERGADNGNAGNRFKTWRRWQKLVLPAVASMDY